MSEIESIFLYPQDVQKLLGVGATKFYELVKLDNFPRPRKMGTVKTAMFLKSELIAWAENLPIDNQYLNDEE